MSWWNSDADMAKIRRDDEIVAHALRTLHPALNQHVEWESVEAEAGAAASEFERIHFPVEEHHNCVKVGRVNQFWRGYIRTRYPTIYHEYHPSEHVPEYEEWRTPDTRLVYSQQVAEVKREPTLQRQAHSIAHHLTIGTWSPSVPHEHKGPYIAGSYEYVMSRLPRAALDAAVDLLQTYGGPVGRVYRHALRAELQSYLAALDLKRDQDIRHRLAQTGLIDRLALRNRDAAQDLARRLAPLAITQANPLTIRTHAQQLQHIIASMSAEERPEAILARVRKDLVQLSEQIEKKRKQG